MPNVCSTGSCGNGSSCNKGQGSCGNQGNRGEHHSERNVGGVCKTMCLQLANEKTASCSTFCDAPHTIKSVPILENMPAQGSVEKNLTSTGLVISQQASHLSLPQSNNPAFNFDEALAKVKQTLATVSSPDSSSLDLSQPLPLSGHQAEALKMEMMNLIKKGQWNAAKSLAIQQVIGTPQLTNGLANKESSPSQDQKYEKVAISELSAKIDKIIRDQNQNQDNTASNLSNFQKGVLLALGVMFAPEAVLMMGSSIFTALSIGPVVEGMSLEFLANPAMMQAAARAGAIIGGGKFLNLFSIFKAPLITGAITKTRAGHSLAGMSVEEITKIAISKGVKTEPNKLLLWSGHGTNGFAIAEEFANKNGMTTLEMTPGGRWLHEMGLFGVKSSPLDEAQANRIWRAVSLQAIKESEGEIQALLGGEIRKGSIYADEKALAEEMGKTLNEMKLMPAIKPKQ